MKVIKSRNLRIRRIKIYSGILGVIFLIIVLVRLNSVNAGSADSKLLKNRVDGVYAVTKLDGVNRLFYLNMYTMNDIPTYCIEPGVDINTDIYDSSTYYGSSGLSYNAAEYVQALIYFGYKYKRHDDYRYYMATQELVWEYLKGINVEWTNVDDFNGDRINIDIYKNEIINLVNRYYTNIRLNFVDGNDLIPYKDYFALDLGGVINNYVVSDVSGMEVSISNNGGINYKVVDASRDKVSFGLKWNNYYNYSSKFYTSGNSQKLISVGNFVVKTYNANFNVIKSDLSVSVVDMDTGLSLGQGDASLEGAKYNIYKDNELILEFLTDINGHADIHGLEAGDYVIKQVSASLGYLINDDDVSIHLDYGDNSIILKEKVITNDITLIKYYGEDDEVEEGVKFLVYYKDNSYKEGITDSLGKVSFVLPYGKYVIKQDNTIYGYKKVDDFEISVDKVLLDDIVYKLNDERIFVNLKINTVDMDSMDKINSEGFSYKIFDKDNNKYLVFDGEEVISTNKDGEVLIDRIGYGNYRIEQVSVIHGYVLNKEEVNFTVDGDMDIDFYNERIKGIINVHVDKEIFFGKDNYFEYKKEKYVGGLLDIYYGDKVIDSGVTDDDGNYVLSILELGDYCVSFGDISKCVKLDTMDNDINVIKKDINIVIKLNKGEVILTDMDNFGDVVNNSTFELYTGDNLIHTGITNDKGKIVIENLVYGDYCFIQKKVPFGYDINNKEYCFSIDSKVKEVKIVNNKNVKRSIWVPNTYSNKNDIIKLFSMIVIILGGIIYKVKVSRL